MRLTLLADRYCIHRLPAREAVPAWVLDALGADPQALVSITRTPDELSVIAPEAAAPVSSSPSTPREGGWRALRVVGTLDFALTGILSSLTLPLANAEISVFALSTYDTDYVLIKAAQLERARSVLEGAGHGVDAPDPARGAEASN